MLRNWISALFIIVSVWRTVDACSCMITHHQTQYCDADFVVLATPVRKAFDPDGISLFYSLKLESICKSNKCSKIALKHGRVYTALNSAACGVNLELNSLYLLGGKVVNGRATIDLCGFHSLWNDMNIEQKKAFQDLYKKGCSCKVCTAGPYCTPDKDTCIYDFFKDRDYCYSNYGVCLPGDNGVCGWNKSDFLEKCVGGN